MALTKENVYLDLGSERLNTATRTDNNLGNKGKDNYRSRKGMGKEESFSKAGVASFMESWKENDGGFRHKYVAFT